MEMDMDQRIDLQPGGSRQKTGGKIKGKSLDMRAEEIKAVQIDVFHQQQGCQKVHDELAVCAPCFARMILTEGTVIHKNRMPVFERDIEGGRILKDHSMVKSPVGQIKGQQRRVAQLAETPFIGIGDEVNFPQFERCPVFVYLKRDQLLFANQLFRQSGTEKGFEIFFSPFRDRPVEFSIAPIHESSRVPEGSRIALNGLQIHRFHSFRRTDSCTTRQFAGKR